MQLTDGAKEEERKERENDKKTELQRQMKSEQKSGRKRERTGELFHNTIAASEFKDMRNTY